MRRTLFHIPKIASVVVMTLLVMSCDAGSFVEPQTTDIEYTPTAATIALDSLLEAITEDDTVTLRAAVLDQEGNPVEGAITWSSSDDRIASVTSTSSSEGSLVAYQPGTASITASYEDLSASATIEVHNRPVDLVYVAGNGQAGIAGAALADSLVVRALDKRGDPVSGVSLNFAVTAGGGSTSPSAARTDVNGFARTSWVLGPSGAQSAVARASEGQTRVKQMKDSVVAFTARIEAAVTAIQVNPEVASIEEGDQIQLDASATTSSGGTIADPQVSWLSTDTAVATISSTGVLRGRKAGSARAIARTTSASGMIADTAAITVTAPTAIVQGVEIRPATATVDTGATQQFDAIALMSDGSEKLADVAWTATGGTINTEGAYTAGAQAGTFRVIGTYQGELADTAAVTVEATPAPVARIALSPPTDTLEVGGTAQLTATVLDANGTVLTGRSVTWSSNNENVATVDGTGLVSSVASGSVVITATAEGVSGSASITVVDAALGSITISPAGDTLYGIGATLSLSAEARRMDGSLIPDPGIEWTSLDQSIVTVDSMGMLTARGIGTAIVVVSAACCSADSGSFTVVDVSAPETADDLAVVGVTTESIELSWTEVDDGTGHPANYAIRYGTPTLSWGDAGATEVVVRGSLVGARASHTFEGLSGGTQYEFQLISYRGTLNVDAVFGGFSNVAGATTAVAGSASLVISPANVSLVVNDTMTLSVEARQADGTVVQNPQVNWSSLNAGVASVNSAGRVTALAAGTARIVGTSDCCFSDTATIQVSSPSSPGFLSQPNEPAGMTLVGEYAWETGTNAYDSGSGQTALAETEGWVAYNTGHDPDDSYLIRHQLAPGDGPLGGADAPWTVRKVYPAGTEGGGGMELHGPNDYDPGISGYNFRELYIRYYVRVNPQWHGHASGINKMVYVRDSGFMWYEMYAEDSNPLGFYIVNQSGSGPGGIRPANNVAYFTRGQWHMVEIRQRQGTSNDGIIQVWVDGNLIVDRNDVDSGSLSFRHVTLSGIWGGAGDSKPQEDWMEFAYVRVSGKQ